MQTQVGAAEQEYWEAQLPSAIVGPEPRTALIDPRAIADQTPELALGARVDEHGRRRGTKCRRAPALIGTAQWSAVADPVGELFEEHEEHEDREQDEDPRTDAQLLARRLLRRLPLTERVVIRWRFGIGENSPLSQAEVAKRLGVSRRTAQSLEYRALDRLQRIAGVAPTITAVADAGNGVASASSRVGGKASRKAA